MDNLSLEVEFPIDNDRLKRESAESKKIISGVNETAAETAERSNQRINDVLEAQSGKYGSISKSINSLKLQMQSYRNIVETSTDPAVIERYNIKLHETAQEIARIKALGQDALIPIDQSAGRAKSSFNGLQNSINQISRELPAFTYSAQTGFMAVSNNIPILVDEIGRLKQANNELVASGQKGVPIWKSLIVGLLSWGTALSLGITLITVYGKEIGNFISSLFKGKNAIDAFKEAQEAIAKQMGSAGEAAAKASLEVETMRRKFDQARSGLITKESVLKQYNESLGKTIGYAQNFNEAEERTLRNGDAYIELMFKKAKAAALAKLYTEEMGKAAEEMAKTDEQSADYMRSGLANSTDPALQQLYKNNAEQNRKEAAKPYEDRAERFKEMWLKSNADIESFVKKNGLNIDEVKPGDIQKESKQLEKQNADYKAMLESAKSFREKLADLDTEYSGIVYADDEKEQNALKKKFEDVRALIVKENEKLAEWNKKNPNKQVSLIDVGAVAPIEDRAMEQLVAQQRQKRLDEALKASETFEQKKLAIEQKYDKLKESLLTLPADEYVQRLKVLEDAQKQELMELEDANVRKMKVFQDLYDGIEDLSDKNARKVVADARAMLNELIKTGKISPQLAKEIEKALNNTGKAIENRLPQRLNQLAGELRNIAGEVSNIDAGFGNLLGTLSNVVGSVGNIKSSIDAIKQAQADKSVLGGITGGIGLVGAGFSAVNSIISLFDKSDEKRQRAEQQRQYSQELQIKAIEAQSKAMERQLALIKDIYGTERLQKYAEAQIDLNKKIEESARNVRGKLINTNDQFENELINRINNGESIDAIIKKYNPSKDAESLKKAIDLRNKINNGLLERISVTTSDSLKDVNKDIERLQYLLGNGKLDATTEAQVKNLINYTQQYKETVKALKEEATGLGFSEITNSLVDMFANGTIAAEDFAKNFEELMKKSILKSFERKALERQLEGFYDDFANYAESGNSLEEAEIAKLRENYNKIIEGAQKQWEEMAKVTGIDFNSDETASSKTMSKSIESITQQQADVLAGQVGGIHLAVVQNQTLHKNSYAEMQSHTTLLKQSYMVQMEIAENTKRTANNTDRLYAVEKHLESINNKIDSDAAIRAGGGRP